MTYTLYNKNLKRQLTHPKYGVWSTEDLKEAQDMLEACREYLRTLKMPETEFNNFVILDAESDKEYD